ncbi:MAG: tRNA and rRNA cytosine-C5-methylase [Caulobacteraceae bacterium]|nr:MAG: tRNA and rRNA cytosine-C5-methylase [Caulobacteraceae bacterium]
MSRTLPTAKGSPRQAAAVLVAEVTEHGRTLDEALIDTKSFNALEGRDRAFARAIASATLRRLGGIDVVLSRYMQQPLPKGAALARAILRTGAAQLLVLGLPPHAVVSETVGLARSAQSAQPFARLMNAVLRKVATDGMAAFAALPPGADLPDWLFTRWRASYGGDSARAIAAALRNEAPLDITVKDNPETWAERLGGVVFEANTVRLAEHGDITAMPGFDDGAWWVQDAAAAMPVRLLGDVRGLDVLDLCAAPGGKTMQLAAAGARVTALDLSEDRLVRVRENLARTHLEADIVCADARTWRPKHMYDVVVLDAPCSATGTLRRHPDVAWLRRPTDIPSLSELQGELLDCAIEMTRPGGKVLYAVCSLEPEEGPAVVDAALGRRPYEIEGTDRILRTTPATRAAEGGMDGFYTRVLHRL